MRHGWRCARLNRRHNQTGRQAEDTQIGAELGRLNNLIKRQMVSITASSEEENVTRMQGMLIHYLTQAEAQGDCFQKDIETAFKMRRSTATGILQLMEQHGLLRREPVERDVRLKRLVLTEKAYALNETICRQLDQTEKIMRRGISEGDLETWFRVCRRIRANLEEYQCNTSEETL